MLAEVIYDGELSGTAMLILFSALLVIIGGLGWCFYRALKATDKTGVVQLPDNGESPPPE